MKKILLICSLFFININIVLAEESAYLTSLTINGYNMTPIFDKYNNTYSVTIDENDTTLDIIYVLEDETSEIEILGNDLITEEEQTVTIKVTNGENKQIYNIIVNKEKNNVEVASFNQEALELNVPKQRNMKVVAAFIIVIWLICVFIVKIILFRKPLKRR